MPVQTSARKRLNWSDGLKHVFSPLLLVPLCLCFGIGCPVIPNEPGPEPSVRPEPEGIPDVNPEGAEPESPIENAPFPSALLVAGENCPETPNVESALDLFRSMVATETDVVFEVAKVKTIQECSGAGGMHALSSRTASNKRFWLGAHACYFSEAGMESGIAVGLGLQTQTLVSVDAGWCVMYPDDTEGFESDLDTQALAWFDTDEAAALFIADVLRD